MSDAASARRALEDAEADLARSMERYVASEGFAETQARVVANVVALYRLVSRALDALVRSLRLAGRQDVSRLGRQVARTEDKLERVLQEVEKLEPQPAPPVAARPDVARPLGTSRAALGGAACSALVVGGAFLAMHPPSIGGAEEWIALSVAGLALVLTTAWAALWFAGRSRGSRA